MLIYMPRFTLEVKIQDSRFKIQDSILIHLLIYMPRFTLEVTLQLPSFLPLGMIDLLLIVGG